MPSNCPTQAKVRLEWATPIACFPSRCTVITFTEFSDIFCEPRLATMCGWASTDLESDGGFVLGAERKSKSPP